MTTREEAEKALALVKALTERAVELARSREFCPWGPSSGRESETALLSIDGDVAVLSWLEDDGEGYGDLETITANLPLSLVLAPDAEYAAWEADTQRRHDEKLKRQREAERAEAAKRKAAAAKAERATYERLKAKYEGKA